MNATQCNADREAAKTKVAKLMALGTDPAANQFEAEAAPRRPGRSGRCRMNRTEYKAAAGAYRADLRKRNGYIVAAYEATDFRKELAEARDALATLPAVPMPRGFSTRHGIDHDEWNSWQIHGFLRSIKSERENEHPVDARNIRTQRRFDMRRYAENIGKGRRFVRFPDLQVEPMRRAA